MNENPTSDHEQAFDRRLSYFLFRLAVGVNMLMHGVVRIPILTKFADKMTQDFAPTVLAGPLVRGFALTLPFVEAAIGLLLVLGLATRWALAAGAALMVALIFGSALRQEWGAVGTQMVYVIAFWLLLWNRHGHDTWSVDALRAPKARRREMSH